MVERKHACTLLQKQCCLCLPHHPWKASRGNTADASLAEMYPSAAGIALSNGKVRFIKATQDRATEMALRFLRRTAAPRLCSLLRSWRGDGTATAAQWTSGSGFAESCVSW